MKEVRTIKTKKVYEVEETNQFGRKTIIQFGSIEEKNKYNKDINYIEKDKEYIDIEYVEDEKE